MQPGDRIWGEVKIPKRRIIIPLNLALPPGTYRAIRKVFTECATEDPDRTAIYYARINKRFHAVASVPAVKELDRLTLFIRRLIDLQRESLGVS